MSALLFDVDQFRQVPSAAHSLAHSQYAARLAAVLGDGSEWDYRGECLELVRPTGTCACTHRGLRFLFTIHRERDGASAIVGSTCITTYAGISPALVKRLQADAERLQAEADELELRARSAANHPEVAALLRQWSRAEYAIDQAAADWLEANAWRRWLPPAIYRRPYAADRLAERQADQVHPFCRLPALTTVRGQAQRLRKYLSDAAAELAAISGQAAQVRA
jgi:hypothetical protein